MQMTIYVQLYKNDEKKNKKHTGDIKIHKKRSCTNTHSTVTIPPG